MSEEAWSTHTYTYIHKHTHTCMYTSGSAGLRQIDSLTAPEVDTSWTRGLFARGFVRFVRLYLLLVLG